jgi:ribosomal protein L12E/L44/L45/RPP1/RPP2
MDEEGGDWFTDAGDDAPPSQPEAASAGPAATPKEGEAPADDAQAKDAPEQEKREIAEEEYLDPDKLLLFKHWIR